MPNHCINEIIFCSVDKAKQAEITAVLCDASGKVDFDVLVPAPLNMWWGSVGQKHEKAFRRTHLDWARENWGTKWNAYSHQPTEATDDSITFRFETAWGPPYPWLAAVFNRFKLSFEHNWLSEGGEPATHGIFDWSKFEGDGFADPWTEEQITDEKSPLHRHLHKLLWGVEEFENDAA